MPVYHGDGPPRVGEAITRNNRWVSNQPTSFNPTPRNERPRSGLWLLITWSCIALIAWFILPSYKTILKNVETHNWQDTKQKVLQTGESVVSAVQQKAKTLTPPASKQHQQPAAKGVNTDVIRQELDKWRNTNLGGGWTFKVVNSAVAETSKITNLDTIQGKSIPAGTTIIYYYIRYKNYIPGHQIVIRLTRVAKGEQAITRWNLNLKDEKNNGTSRIRLLLKRPLSNGSYRITLSDKYGAKDVYFFTVGYLE